MGKNYQKPCHNCGEMIWMAWTGDRWRPEKNFRPHWCQPLESAFPIPSQSTSDQRALHPALDGVHHSAEQLHNEMPATLKWEGLIGPILSIAVLAMALALIIRYVF
jgi:hypothetical protein